MTAVQSASPENKPANTRARAASSDLKEVFHSSFALRDPVQTVPGRPVLASSSPVTAWNGVPTRSFGNQAILRLLRSPVLSRDPFDGVGKGAANFAAQLDGEVVATMSAQASRGSVTNLGGTRSMLQRQVCANEPALPIQAKLEVGAVNDPLEYEADRVAERVMRAPQEPSVPPPAIQSAPQIQRKCGCGGGCSDCRLSPDNLILQTKLSIDTVGDAHERQADRIADSVMAIDAPAHAAVHRKASDQQQLTQSDEEEIALHGAPRTVQRPLLQRMGFGPDSPSHGISSNHLETQILARQGLGAPLPQESLALMESRFQTDFGNVRIHTDGDANRLNDELHAYAFTTGRDIFFARGQFRPGTETGDRLLAHELTHVVQQSGTKAAASPKRVQRFGKWVHQQIEGRLIRANKEDLLAEVAIPGAVRPTVKSLGFDFEKLNVRGYADLYRSHPDKVVPGVKAQSADPDDPLAVGDPPLKYLNIDKPDKDPRKGWFSGVIFSPKVKRTKGATPYLWSSLPGFPESFEVGEIKALFESDALAVGDTPGTGMLQWDNYTSGLENFVKRVFEDSGHKTRSSTAGKPLPIGEAQGGIKIPPEIDYSQFDSQPPNPSRQMMIIKKDFGKRIWVHSKEPGLLFYFLLPENELRTPEYRQKVDRQFELLYPLVEEVTTDHPGTIPRRKAKPGSRSTLVQRQATPDIEETTEPPPTEFQGTWRTKWESWKKRRKEWKGDVATPGSAEEFLEHSGKGPLRKIEIDQKLGLPSREMGVSQERHKLLAIKRWAGPLGWTIGLLRFRFGWLFDKVYALFQKVSDKFAAFRENAHVSEGGASGWVAKAVRVIGDVVVYLVKRMAAAAYSIAADCVSDTVHAIVSNFEEEALEKLKPVLDPIFEGIQALRDKIEETYGPIIEAVEFIFAAFAKYQKWADIVSDIKWALRLLIEAISCGIPPGLGCLWGVLVQVGFDLAAARAIATNLFKTKIAQPAARTLVDSIAGNSIRTFIVDAMSGIGLDALAMDVKACQPVPRDPRRRFDRDVTFDPDDPDLAQARRDLEAEYGERMIQDLEAAFGSGGNPATKDEVEDLIYQLQVSGLTIEEFRKKLKRDKQNRYDINQAMAVASSAGGGGSSKKATPSADQDIPTIDMSAQPPAGHFTENASGYGVVAQAESAHHPDRNRIPIRITVYVLDKKGRVAVLTNVEVIVKSRDTFDDGSDVVTYSVVHGKSFSVRGITMALPDELRGEVR